MKPPWFEKARSIHHQFVARAQKVGHLTGPRELPPFFAMAIAGESGELANLFKKQWRGDHVPQKKIADEMADVRIYLEHLATELNIDLDAACGDKLEIVQDRLNAETQP